MQKITPFLWFDTQAEEAARFYVSLFENAKIKDIARYREAGPGPAGSVMTVAFQLDGQEFVAINGGPHFKFTEADYSDQAHFNREFREFTGPTPSEYRERAPALPHHVPVKINPKHARLDLLLACYS